MTSGRHNVPDQSAAWLAAIVTSSWDAIVSKDLAGIVTSWNPSAERIFGFSAAQMVGQSIRRIIPADYQAEEDTILERIARGHSIAAFQTSRLRADGAIIPVSVTVSPIVDPDGRVVGASKIARDLGDDSALAALLRQSDARFRMMANNIPQLAWMADEKGYIYWYNQRWYDYTGTTLEAMKGWGWKAVHHPDHVDRVVERIQRSWDSGTVWEDTFPLRGAEGGYRWFLSRAEPIRDEHGKVLCWFGTNTDITEERSQQEQIRLLMREVNHRSKNMLAMIQSLARRTAPSGDKAFIQRFEQRIQALAANQDLLVTRQWQFVELRQLVEAQLFYFEDLLGRRIFLDGPEVMLKPGPTETIGLAIHELATNAAKYGALSNENGILRISWGIDDQAAHDPHFWLDWREKDGPPVIPPDHEGFGSTVIRRMPKLSLDVDIEMSFEPEGVHWRLSGTAGSLLYGHDGEVQSRAAPLPAQSVGLGPILIVEDEPLVALDLMNQLAELDYWTIGPARTPAAALDLLERQHPVGVLLDVRLAEDSSSDVALALSEQNIPFIVLTGFGLADLDEPFLGAPILRKPVQADELAQLMRTILPRRDQVADPD